MVGWGQSLPTWKHGESATGWAGQGKNCWCPPAPGKAKQQSMFLYGLSTYHRPWFNPPPPKKKNKNETKQKQNFVSYLRKLDETRGGGRHAQAYLHRDFVNVYRRRIDFNVKLV